MAKANSDVKRGRASLVDLAGCIASCLLRVNRAIAIQPKRRCLSAPNPRATKIAANDALCQKLPGADAVKIRPRLFTGACLMTAIRRTLTAPSRAFDYQQYARGVCRGGVFARQDRQPNSDRISGLDCWSSGRNYYSAAWGLASASVYAIYRSFAPPTAYLFKVARAA